MIDTRAFTAFILCLSLAVSSVQANQIIIEVTINWSESIAFDADIGVRIEGVSNGIPFIADDPAFVTTWNMVSLGDRVEFFTTGSARSGPTGSFTDAGNARVDASMTAVYNDDVNEGSIHPISQTISYLISATGNDAFTIANLDIIDPGALPITLAFLNGTADTLFGDTEQFMSVGTFGGPLAKEQEVFLESMPLDELGLVTLPAYTLFVTATGISSEANFELSMSFSLVPIPAAAWLFGSALGMLGWMRRKAI